jgi:phospholipid/cholesterol/gamma-HCH transport system substrate-binding protein
MGEDSKHEIKHILLGLIVVAVTVSVFLFSYRGGPESEVTGYQLTARFNTTDGIAVGSEIVLTGVKVGQVTGRSYDAEKQNVLVEMTLQEGIIIPRESTLAIVSDGLLGAKYLKIEPGGSVENMADGEAFEYVQDSIPLVELLEKIVIDAENRRAGKTEPKPKKNDPFELPKL